MSTPALDIAELDEVFAALRGDTQVSLPESLKSVIALAKRKHITAEQLQQVLDGYGIQGTPKFHAWLQAQFEGVE